MKKALVVLSGGQDSTWCLYWAKRHFDAVHAVTYAYGQRHHSEIQAAKTVGAMAGVKDHAFVNLGFGTFAGTSPLTSDRPLEQYESAEAMEKKVGDEIESTFVPGRNAVFLAVACGRAASAGIDDVVVGVSQEDYANYPDCRADFIASMQEAMRHALANPSMTIHAPLLGASKADAVRFAFTQPDLWAALAYTHTAYDGGFPPTSHDHASLLRARAFLDADLPDPLVVRAWSAGLMALPPTRNYRTLEGSE